MKLKFKDKFEYTDYWGFYIELERDAEKDFHLNEILNFSGKERERKGRAILNLKAKYEKKLEKVREKIRKLEEELKNL